jgi:anti-anti-sigma factor
MPAPIALVTEENGVKIIAFARNERGQADLDRVRQYFAQDMIQQTTGWKRLIIDLSGVTTLDSAALGPLVQKLRDVQELQGSLALCGVTSPALREIFALTRFDKVFPIVQTRTEALAIATASS